MSQEWLIPSLALTVVGFSFLANLSVGMGRLERGALLGFLSSVVLLGAGIAWELRAEGARSLRKARNKVKEIPISLRSACNSVYMGKERELCAFLYLPNSIRLKHVHILGATGAGKTESVILNFLKQDVLNGHGAIIADGKGDQSFLVFLKKNVPEDRLQIFDLGSSDCVHYNPLADGSRSEAAQRLFSSLNWSEEYYKSKALTALQRIFQSWKGTKNPSLPEISKILESPERFADAVADRDSYPVKAAQKDHGELSALRDQVRLLCSEHLASTLAPCAGNEIDLREAGRGKVIYFRLQSLLSRQLASTLGRLLINHLSFLAGSSHRKAHDGNAAFIPTYLDEFAIFACPEFADLISKARSAGIALHFSHQSVGDLDGVQPGFLSQIMDNTATKIVMRVNDPDTAETFARAFGTFETESVTKKVSNAEDLDFARADGMGSLREVREFRASPDLLKSLPVGAGAVLVAHGEDLPSGATSVFKIQFPKL